MKLTVTVNLNVRVGKPGLNAPCYQYIAPGSILEVDGTLYPGDKYDGISSWYKDEAGNYYWSGGVEEIKDSIIDYPDWMSELKIPTIWNYSTGKDVGVAVVDTGIDIQNEDLIYNKDKYFVFDKAISLQDQVGHGTHCAGLIGAKNKIGNVIGVAPDCNLFVCKIAEGGSMNESDCIRYADAINWCADQDNIHVISISWGSFLNDTAIINKIQTAINYATLKNKVVVCAMGDAFQFNDPGPLYPVSLNNTFGIGSMPVENILYPYINDHLLTSTIGQDIPSYGLGKTIVKLSGTSQSNAIIAGIISLIIKKKNFNYTPSEMKELLSTLSINKIYNGIKIPLLSGELLINYFQS